MNLKRMSTMFLVAIAAASARPAQEFNFNIDPAKTWTNGYARLRLWTDGTIVGNYDPVKNLLGTRTKVGAGPFLNLTQNDPVPVMPFFEMGHAALVRTSGTFHLSVNTTNMTATLTNYNSNRVPQSNLFLSSTVALNNDVFRTANPDAVYSANVPPQQLGTLQVDRFTVTQRAGARTGSMVRLNDGSYRVVINFMADARIRVAEFGQFEPMSFPVAYSLVGNLKINGMSATFGYPPGDGGESVLRDVDVTLPAFPIQLGAGITVKGSYLMNTTVKTVGIQIIGTRQMAAVSI